MKKMLSRGAFAAAALAACALLGSAPAGATATATWHPVFNATSFPNGRYTSVAATSPKNAWAVGTKNSSSGLIAARWNGTSWKWLPVPGASSFKASPFPEVVASSATNMWIFGWLTNGTRKILRWDGSWHSVPLPPDGAADSPIVFSSTDAWAIGVQRITSAGACSSTPLWNWTGAKWIAHMVGFCAFGLSGTWAKDVWAAGIESLPLTKARITAAYWNGTRWRSVTMPHPYTYDSFPQIVVGSISNVWVAGTNPDSVHPAQSGAGWALHWNGKSWSRTPASSLDTIPGVALVGSDLWLGPDQEWNGSAWLNQTPDDALFTRGGTVNPSLMTIAAIPGSASIWGVGSLYTSGALIAAFGTVP